MRYPQNFREQPWNFRGERLSRLRTGGFSRCMGENATKERGKRQTGSGKEMLARDMPYREQEENNQPRGAQS